MLIATEALTELNHAMPILIFKIKTAILTRPKLIHTYTFHRMSKQLWLLQFTSYCHDEKRVKQIKTKK